MAETTPGIYQQLTPHDALGWPGPSSLTGDCCVVVGWTCQADAPRLALTGVSEAVVVPAGCQP